MPEERDGLPDPVQETATPPHGDPTADSGAAAPTAGAAPTAAAAPTGGAAAADPSAAAGANETATADGAPGAASFETQLAERTADLQRLQAEYVNYRRRVERDRDVAREAALVSLLSELLPVLDEIHLARQHGDLDSGPFKAIAERLEGTLAKVGLTRYGEPGEPFDPQVHEALMQTADGEVTEPTATQILQPGYRLSLASGERVLRPARVAVATPE